MTEMIKVKLNGRYDIIIPKHRADRVEWYTEEGWEKKRLHSIRMNLGGFNKDIIYYIGAEEGEMPALCQMWGVKVVLFEPNPKVWPNIKAIWEANKLEFPSAIFSGFASDTNDPPDSYIHKNGEWPASADGSIITDHGFKELRDPDGIQQIKIDSFVKRSRIIPTAISLDVEGAEGRVLKGAEETLKEYHPKIWLSLHPEFMIKNFGQWGRELRDWIIKLGYKETLIDYQHEVHLMYSV